MNSCLVWSVEKSGDSSCQNKWLSSNVLLGWRIFTKRRHCILVTFIFEPLYFPPLDVSPLTFVHFHVWVFYLHTFDLYTFNLCMFDLWCLTFECFTVCPSPLINLFRKYLAIYI
jgi:hypothetical protein